METALYKNKFIIIIIIINKINNGATPSSTRSTMVLHHHQQDQQWCYTIINKINTVDMYTFLTYLLLRSLFEGFQQVFAQICLIWNKVQEIHIDYTPYTCTALVPSY